MCASYSVHADWINLTGAETAPNIAEIYILDDRVKLVLEIYVAVVAVLPDLRPGYMQDKNEWTVVAVTGMIGLLHGLGFSFVLQNILQVTSPNIWQSLLAFNVGVEIGQLLIVMIAWLVFYLISFSGARITKLSHFIVAGICAGTAIYWVIERGNNVLTSL